jgi:hypothetical protein
MHVVAATGFFFFLISTVVNLVNCHISELGQTQAAVQREEGPTRREAPTAALNYYVNTIRSAIDATPALVGGGWM